MRSEAALLRSRLMADESIPEDVARLLETIETYEQLEVLLLLYRGRQQRLAIDEVADRLGTSASEVDAALAQLRSLDLIAFEATGNRRVFWYLGTPQRDAALGSLARCYDEQRLSIVKLMNANAIERLRTAAIRRFADAFVVGSKKKDG
jgi:hypothetical protein